MRIKYQQFIATFFLLAALLGWQTRSAAQKDVENLTITASFKTGASIVPQTPLELTLNRILKSDERIALIIGNTDMTGIFTLQDTKFKYDSSLLPLPTGESNITVYLIKNGAWKEIARFVLNVKTTISAIPETTKPAPENPTNKPAETENSGAIEKPTAENAKSGNTVTTDSSDKSPTEPTPPITPETRPFGFDKSVFLPGFSLNIKPRQFQSNSPAEISTGEQKPLADFALQGSVKNEMKRGFFGLNSNFDFAGSSVQGEALRFGTLGEEAPQVDLASYLFQFDVGKAKFAFGHTSFGNNRHLVSSFSSRGLSVNVPLNKMFDVSAGVLNGTSLVGFGNFVGLKKLKHQVQGATLGIEFFPKRQNAMRVEITGFNGYIQPLNNVSEGRINDAERSRGLGLRFFTSDKSERFKLELGYVFSRFFNPNDLLLDPEGNAVPIPAVSRSAQYLEASYQILRDVSLTKTRKINLNIAFRQEFVEPLFKSLGASAQADKTSQDFALDGSIGEITLQFGHTRFNDNLRNVPSILKSLTRANRFSVALPLATFFTKSEKTAKFFPRLAYSIDQTHQFGAGIPVNGGFEIKLSAIPDQLNTNHTFSSTWQFSKFNFEYRLNRSFADNRQTEREIADQLGLVHGFAVGINPLPTLSFTVGYNLENSHSFEANQINRTKALTFGGNWQPFKGATLSGNFSHSLAGDTARTNKNNNANYDFQFAYNFNLEKSKFRKFGMQAFIRYADTFSRSRDFTAEVNNLTKTRILNTGITFNFF